MYQDNNGNIFESYEAACHYYGADTPAMIAAEETYWFERDCVEMQDLLETSGPVFGFFGKGFIEEIPF